MGQLHTTTESHAPPELEEASLFGFYVVDPDFRLVQASDGARAIFGHMEPLIGRDCVEVLRSACNEPAASDIISAIHRALETGQATRYSSVAELRPEGRCYDWRVERIMLSDGRFGAVCHFHDLSERQRLESALQESEARFRNMADHLPVIVWTSDADGSCVFLSKSWYEVTGQNPETALGVGWLEMVHPEDKLVTERIFMDAIRKQRSFRCEYRLRSRDGSYRWVLDSARPRQDADGSFLGHIGSVIDITDRRRAEIEQQRLSEQRQLALDAARLGWWHYDPATKNTVFDRRYAEIFGISGDHVPNDYLLSKVHPDDLPRVVAAFESTLNPENPTRCSVEFRVLRERGTIAWVEVHGVANFEGQEGKRRVAGILGTVKDITERKMADQALRASERRLRTFFDSDMVGTLYWTMDGKIVGANDKFLSMVGYTREDLNRHILDWSRMTPPEYRKADEQAMERIRTAGVDRPYEKAYIRKDGTRIPVIVGAAMLEEGGHNGVAFVLDISERKRVEQELAQTRERLETALAAGDVATWVLDVSRKLVYGDRNLRAMFALDREMTGGEPIETYLGVIHAEDRARVEQMLQNALSSGESLEVEFRVTTAGVGTRWLLSRGRAERDAEGKPVRMPGVLMDVTQRKTAEIELEKARAELREYANNLEQLVRTRTIRLQEVVAELEHFSYTITHDMRAPLRAMRGFSEVLQDIIREQQNTEMQMFLDKIVRSAERMDLLITDALNYSKAVRQDLPLAPTSVRELLEGMLDTYPEFQPDHANIRVEGSIPVVMGNEAGLTQCFSNLIGNSVKFVAPGRIPEVLIWGELRPDDSGRQWVRIWVEDNGIGIPERMLPRVFDMFSRGTHEYEGTGIGLALVRKVVQRMGGRVGVLSEAGVGSSFWIELKHAGSPPDGTR